MALAGAFLVKGELEAGRSEAEKALALNPDSFVYLEWIGADAEAQRRRR